MLEFGDRGRVVHIVQVRLALGGELGQLGIGLVQRLVALGHGVQAIALDGLVALEELRVGKTGHQAVVPVEAVGGHFRGRVQIGGELLHVRVQGHGGVEGAGGRGEPVHAAQGLGCVRADAQDGALGGAVDADVAVLMTRGGGALGAVGVVLGAVVGGGEQVLHVRRRQLLVGAHGPGDVEALGTELGRRAGKTRIGGRQAAAQVPLARGVVQLVEPGVGGKRDAGIEVARQALDGLAGIFLVGGHVHEQVVLADPLGQIGAAHVVVLIAQRVGQIEVIDALAVGLHHVAVVGHAPRDPVVAPDVLPVPDLVRVAEGHAVGLVGAVLLHEHAEARNAFAGAFNVGQRDGGQVLLADAAGNLGLVVGVAGLSLGRLVGDERVGAEHAGVGRDGLGGRHGHVRRVDAGFGPHAVCGVGVGRAGVAQRVVGQIDGQVAGHAGVDARLVLRHDHDHLLRIEREVLAVLVAGDDGGAVVGGATAHEKRCASHGVSLVGA